MIRKLVPSQVTEVGEDEVEVVMSTGAIARDGHILVPGGANLTHYRANPVVLWQHDPDQPVGNAEGVRVDGDKIVARIRFAPLGVSEVADRTRGLVKSGVIGAVSVGFEPTEGEPLDPARPRGGQRFTGWELLECSFVSVAADTGAVVTARAHDAQIRAGKVLSDANRTTLEAIHGSIEHARGELRDFIDGTDTDTTDIQTSGGVDDSDGAENGRALSLEARRRRLRAFELAGID